ncbi:Tubulin tyrosine ligase [Aduncisulcus paluster]|uniref:Tubulin tyrosine ligase n=1 Tax=Aduncisulcus paluster TaxID=2918883 RepID=A0ABQ5K6V0_9EUKA|nr:Tubulin tyrosine ligase [Aduncisulcus paluster]
MDGEGDFPDEGFPIFATEKETKGKKKKSKKKKAVTVCLDYTRYKVLHDICTKRGWKIVSSDSEWNFCFSDHCLLDKLSSLRAYQRINHFPGMYELARKDALSRNMNRYRRRFEKAYSFFPASFLLPHQAGELKSFHSRRKTKTLYISKPTASCQGRGIFLFKNPEDIDTSEPSVVQQYLAKPYLIDGFKFDLRIYVCLLRISPLVLLIHKKGLARFATEKYNEPTSSNLDCLYMHLTNYAINKDNPNFVFNEDVAASDVGSKWSLEATNERMEKEGVDVSKMWTQINDLIIKTVVAVQPTLAHTYRASRPDDPYCKGCFEILGFDVLIDHKLTPWLIEVNHSPSFRCDTPLDKDIKFDVINEAIMLSGLSSKNRTDYYRKESMRKFERVYGKGKVPEKIRKKAELKERSVIEKEEEEAKNIHAHLEPIIKNTGYTLIYPLKPGVKDPYVEFSEVPSCLKTTYSTRERTNALEEEKKKEEKEKQKKEKPPKMRPTKPISTCSHITTQQAIEFGKGVQTVNGTHGPIKLPVGIHISERAERARITDLVLRDRMIALNGVREFCSWVFAGKPQVQSPTTILTTTLNSHPGCIREMDILGVKEADGGGIIGKGVFFKFMGVYFRPDLFVSHPSSASISSTSTGLSTGLTGVMAPTQPTNRQIRHQLYEKLPPSFKSKDKSGYTGRTDSHVLDKIPDHTPLDRSLIDSHKIMSRDQLRDSSDSTTTSSRRSIHSSSKDSVKDGSAQYDRFDRESRFKHAERLHEDLVIQARSELMAQSSSSRYGKPHHSSSSGHPTAYREGYGYRETSRGRQDHTIRTMEQKERVIAAAAAQIKKAQSIPSVSTHTGPYSHHPPSYSRISNSSTLALTGPSLGVCGVGMKSSDPGRSSSTIFKGSGSTTGIDPLCMIGVKASGKKGRRKDDRGRDMSSRSVRTRSLSASKLRLPKPQPITRLGLSGHGIPPLMPLRRNHLQYGSNPIK